MINEAKLATGYIYTNVKGRNSILEFIDKNGEVTLDQLKKHFSEISESEGKTFDIRYLTRNKHLIDRNIKKDGTSTYLLTNKGRNVLEASKKNIED